MTDRLLTYLLPFTSFRDNFFHKHKKGCAHNENGLGKHLLFRNDGRVVRQASKPTAARPVHSPQKETLAQKRTTDMPSKLVALSAPSWAPGKEPVRKLATFCRSKVHSSRVSLLVAFLGGESRLPCVLHDSYSVHALSAYCKHDRRTPSLANASCSEMIAAWCVRHPNLPQLGRCYLLEVTRRPRSGRQKCRAN